MRPDRLHPRLASPRIGHHDPQVPVVPGGRGERGLATALALELLAAVADEREAVCSFGGVVQRHAQRGPVEGHILQHHAAARVEVSALDRPADRRGIVGGPHHHPAAITPVRQLAALPHLRHVVVVVGIIGGHAPHPRARRQHRVPQRLGARVGIVALVVRIDGLVRHLEEGQATPGEGGQELGIGGVVEVGVVEHRDPTERLGHRDRVGVELEPLGTGGRGHPCDGVGVVAHEQPVHVQQALQPRLGRRQAVLDVLRELDPRHHQQPVRPGDLRDAVVIGEDDEVVAVLGVPARHVGGRGVAVARGVAVQVELALLPRGCRSVSAGLRRRRWPGSSRVRGRRPARAPAPRTTPERSRSSSLSQERERQHPAHGRDPGDVSQAPHPPQAREGADERVPGPRARARGLVARRAHEQVLGRDVGIGLELEAPPEIPHAQQRGTPHARVAGVVQHHDGRPGLAVAQPVHRPDDVHPRPSQQGQDRVLARLGLAPGSIAFARPLRLAEHVAPERIDLVAREPREVHRHHHLGERAHVHAEIDADVHAEAHDEPEALAEHPVAHERVEPRGLGAQQQVAAQAHERQRSRDADGQPHEPGAAHVHRREHVVGYSSGADPRDVGPDSPRPEEQGVARPAPPRRRPGPRARGSIALVRVHGGADEAQREQDLPPVHQDHQHRQHADVVHGAHEAHLRPAIEVVEVERVVERRAVRPRVAALEQAGGAVDDGQLEHHHAHGPRRDQAQRRDLGGPAQDRLASASPAVERVGLAPAGEHAQEQEHPHHGVTAGVEHGAVAVDRLDQDPRQDGGPPRPSTPRIISPMCSPASRCTRPTRTQGQSESGGSRTSPTWH